MGLARLRLISSSTNLEALRSKSVHLTLCLFFDAPKAKALSAALLRQLRGNVQKVSISAVGVSR